MKELNEILAEMKERCEAATPGPWKRVTGDYVGFVGEQFFAVTDTSPDEDGDLKSICASQRVKLENADFIAHARSDLPKLLACLEKALEQRDWWLGEACERHVENDVNKFIEQDNARIAEILQAVEEEPK